LGSVGRSVVRRASLVVTVRAQRNRDVGSEL
jgi:hypothetical protein